MKIEVDGMGQITVPDEWSDAQIDQYVEAEFARADPTRGMSAVQRNLAGAGKAFYDVDLGVRGLLGMAEPGEVQERRRLDAPLMATPSGQTGNIGGMMAQMGAVPATSVPALAGLTGLYGAIQPAESGEERAINALTAAAGGAAGGAVGKYIASGAPKLDAFEKATVDAAKGVAKRLGGKLRLTPGAITGHEGMQGMEASMKSFAMTSRPMYRIADNNQKILNKAALRAIGQDGNKITPNHIGRAYADLGKKFDDFKDVKSKIPIDADDVARVQQASDEFMAEWGQAMPGRIPKVLEQIQKAADDGGLTGAEYVRQRSRLSHRAYKEMTRGEGDRELGVFLHEVVDTLDDAALKVAPAGKYDEYAKVRDQYRNLKNVTRWVNQQGNLKGPSMANNLAQKDNRYQRGERPQFQETADLHDMVRFAGQHQDIVGDSGTATRMSLPMFGTTMAGPGTLAALMSGGDPLKTAAASLAFPAVTKLGQAAYLSPGTRAAVSYPGLLGSAPRAAGLLTRGAGAAGAGYLLGRE